MVLSQYSMYRDTVGPITYILCDTVNIVIKKYIYTVQCE